MRSRDSLLGHRAAGVLLPVSALPGSSGIGNFGSGAYRFIDALHKSGVSFWQILPLNPQGRGFSPYSSDSAFAISPLYLDCMEDCDNDSTADYRKALHNTQKVYRQLLEDFDDDDPSYKAFLNENAFWLNAYAEFKKNQDVKKIQFILRKQWDKLKNYANSKGIKIIGDVPIYVAANSADVAAHRSLFAVGNDFTPLSVAGVPPDLFSADGQLWGNPVYNWNAHKNTDYEWWLSRLKYSLDLFDYIRIDHFRAFSTYYSIPYGSKTARTGVWEYANGRELFSKAFDRFGAMNIIAEDLGDITPDVTELMEFTGFAGMKVMQFAFSEDKGKSLLPEYHPKNSVCYTGTHDNDTTNGWYDTLPSEQKSFFEDTVPKFNGMSPAHRLIKYSALSSSELFIIPMQDILSLDSTARFNTPSTERGNWKWRMTNEQLQEFPSVLRELLKGSGRI